MTKAPTPTEKSKKQESYDKSPYTDRKIQKAREIWLSPMTKVPTSTEKSKKQHDNTKRHQKLRLHKDCRPTYNVGRSVGVTTATLLVCLNTFTGSQPSH